MVLGMYSSGRWSGGVGWALFSILGSSSFIVENACSFSGGLSLSLSGFDVSVHSYIKHPKSSGLNCKVNVEMNQKNMKMIMRCSFRIFCAKMKKFSMSFVLAEFDRSKIDELSSKWCISAAICATSTAEI